ncbi:Rv3651-like N-terminal domain-containing protein [Mycobacterium sp. smrl_JER01]
MTRKARDLDAKRRIKVDDAAAVIAAFRWWANLPPSRNPGRQWAQDVAEMMFEKWSDSPVVLRVDDEFAGALVSANTDVELVPDWLTRFPFNAVAYSLATPLSLHDGQRLCRYLGMVVAGTVSEYRHVGGSGPAPVLGNLKLQGADGRGVFTAYTRIPAAQGVRCMWVYQEEGDPNPQLQSVTFPLRGDLAVTTLADLIETQIEGAHDAGNSDGKELPVLIPLSLSLLLYSAAGDPEIDWPPPEQISRPQQISRAQIGNLGWRTGASLRQYRRQAGERTGDVGIAGWRLPPHIRIAHWHRVRVAERDENGSVLGNRLGVEGVDWHYELRWYPPTPVNADGGVAPAVRDLN